MKRIVKIIILLLFPILTFSQYRDCTVKDITYDLESINHSKYVWNIKALEGIYKFSGYKEYKPQIFYEELKDVVGNTIFDLEKHNDDSIKFVISDLKEIYKHYKI
jgi:hypothetical protein